MLLAQVSNPNILKHLPKTPKISVYGQEVRFKGIAEAQAKEIMLAAQRREYGEKAVTLSKLTTKALTPAEVSAHGLTIPEGAKAYVAAAANTLVDRVKDKFTKRVLEKYASQISQERISLCFNHQTSKIVGRVAKGWVEEMPNNPGDYEMKVVFYTEEKFVVPDQPKMSIPEAIEKGYLQNISIQFTSYNTLQEVGDSLITILDDHPEDPSRAEIMEVSLVWFPAQYQANVKFKSLRDPENRDDGYSLFHKTVIKMEKSFNIGDVTCSVTTADDGNITEMKGFDEVRAALDRKDSEAKALKEQNEALQKQLEDAKAPMVKGIQDLYVSAKTDKLYQRSEAELKSLSLKEINEMYLKLKAKAQAVNPQNQFAGDFNQAGKQAQTNNFGF